MTTPALPTYTHVPGRTPHPVNDPRGHSFGTAAESPAPLDPDRPRESPDYVRGIFLFNSGYYWEAHEVWEGLWHAAGRAGTTATFLKGLIKLAAAGVKRYEGRPVGVLRHADRAGALLREVARDVAPEPSYAGLPLKGLIALTAAAGTSECGTFAGDPPRAGLMGLLPELTHSP